MDLERYESAAENVDEILAEGIAAAKAGERERARNLLMRVTQLDGQRLSAWLWLSGLVEGLEDQEACLENALALDPGNHAAAKGLAVVRKKRADQALQEGITAARKGWMEEANDLLRRVVELDEGNVTAWLWLSSVVSSLDEMEICLENVLTLDPGNQAALKGLAQVRQQKLVQQPTTVELTPLTVPSAAAADVIVEVAESGEVGEEKGLDNEYICPVCGSQTRPDDKKCPSCRADLWIRSRKQENRSTWLWMGLTVQVFNTAWYWFILVALIGLVIELLHLEHGIEFREPGAILGLYFGATGGVPPEIAGIVLDLVPRVTFFAMLVPAVFSLALLVGLYLRWRPAYFVFLADAIYTVIVMVASGLNQSGISSLFRGYALVIPALLLAAAFQMRDDFAYEKRRILLRLDTDVSSGLGYLVRGREYAKRKMWALAALHLQRAVGMMPSEVEGYVWLALSHIELGQYHSAARALADARQVNPNDARIADVAGLLESRRRP